MITNIHLVKWIEETVLKSDAAPSSPTLPPAGEGCRLGYRRVGASSEGRVREQRSHFQRGFFKLLTGFFGLVWPVMLKAGIGLRLIGVYSCPFVDEQVLQN